MLKGILIDLPSKLDPSSVETNTEWVFLSNLGINLVDVNFDGEIEPTACASWNISNDLLKYEFQLRKDIRDSVGKQMTANDWVNTLRRLVRNKTVHTAFSDIVQKEDNVEYIDDFCFRINLIKPMSNLLYRLSTPEFILISNNQELREGCVDNFSISTGAYYIESHDKNVINLKINKYYVNNYKNSCKKIQLIKSNCNIENSLDDLEKTEIDFYLDEIMPFSKAYKLIKCKSEQSELNYINLKYRSVGMFIFNENSKVFNKTDKRTNFKNAIDLVRSKYFDSKYISKLDYIFPAYHDDVSKDIEDKHHSNFTNSVNCMILNGADKDIVSILEDIFNNMNAKINLHRKYLDDLYRLDQLKGIDLAFIVLSINENDELGTLKYLLNKDSNRSLVKSKNKALYEEIDHLFLCRDAYDKSKKILSILKLIDKDILAIPLFKSNPYVFIYNNNCRIKKELSRCDKVLLNMLSSKGG